MFLFGAKASDSKKYIVLAQSQEIWNERNGIDLKRGNEKIKLTINVNHFTIVDGLYCK